MNNTRTLEAHLSDLETLNESLKFMATQLGKKHIPSVQADVLETGHSFYMLYEGPFYYGEVKKTAKMWKFTSDDNCVYRGANVDAMATFIL